MTELMHEWKMEERSLKDLKPNPKNPRRMSKQMAEQLTKSLDKFGQCEPIVINQDNTIIGGHQRVKTLKNLGAHTAYVMVPCEPLSEEEADELCIRLNKNSGIFDDDLLANAWDIDLLVDCGFTPQELHLDIEPEEEKECSGATITISVTDGEHADMLERHLNTVLCDYPGAKCRVKKK